MDPTKPKRPSRNPAGRPAQLPTDQNRAIVAAVMSVGGDPDDCARILKMNRETVLKYYRPEVEAGRTMVIQRIAMGVVQRALAGDNGCSFFYLKCQAGWSEKVKLEIAGADLAAMPEAEIERELEELRARRRVADGARALAAPVQKELPGLVH